MSTPHTPGPWTAHHRHVVAHNCATIQTGAGPVAVSHAICDADGRNDDIARANARLIAAAPDLLAALEAVSIWLIAPDLSKETLAAVQSIARAAIAKATGREA